MLHRTRRILIPAIAAAVVVVSFAACEKVSYGKLKANYHFTNANALFKERDYRKAIAQYESALQANPQLVQAYRFLGESYKQLYKPGDNEPQNLLKRDKALEALNKAHEIDPTNRDIIFSLGDMFDKLQRFEDAEKLYLRILDLEPNNMNNYYVVAEFYKRYAAERPDAAKKAEQMYLRRIEADPENPQGYAYAANYYEALPASAENIGSAIKNFDTASEFWKKRIALAPDSAEAWLAQGVNRWSRSFRFQNLSKEERLKTAQDSMAAIQKAIELDPNYPEPYAWMGPLYKAVLAKLEPEKEARYNAEGDKFLDKFQDLRKRAAERKKLEDELKKSG